MASNKKEAEGTQLNNNPTNYETITKPGDINMDTVGKL